MSTEQRRADQRGRQVRTGARHCSGKHGWGGRRCKGRHCGRSRLTRDLPGHKRRSQVSQGDGCGNLPGPPPPLAGGCPMVEPDHDLKYTYLCGQLPGRHRTQEQEAYSAAHIRLDLRVDVQQLRVHCQQRGRRSTFGLRGDPAASRSRHGRTTTGCAVSHLGQVKMTGELTRSGYCPKEPIAMPFPPWHVTFCA